MRVKVRACAQAVQPLAHVPDDWPTGRRVRHACVHIYSGLVQTGWIIYMYATEPNVGALRLTPTDSFTDPIVQFVSLFHRSLQRIPGI